MKTKYIFLINTAISQNVRKTCLGIMSKMLKLFSKFSSVALPSSTCSFLSVFILISVEHHDFEKFTSDR